MSLDGDSVEIAVSDTGVGMAASSGSRGRLGSTIVRALVAQIGADMAVTSAAGQGTRTVLRFPQRAPFGDQPGGAAQSKTNGRGD